MSSVDEINAFLRADSIDLDGLEAALDAADHQTRLAATREWSGKLQSKLFEATEGRAVTAAQVLPTDELEREVIHHGTNTLPAFRQFQKRFCWVETGQGRQIIGYNHNSGLVMTTVGPGYYVAYEDPDGPEFVVDYHQLPTTSPDFWPPIIKNTSRLGILVYAGMRDRLRRVSDHVTIGRAYKKKPMNSWFSLVREDLE